MRLEVAVRLPTEFGEETASAPWISASIQFVFVLTDKMLSFCDRPPQWQQVVVGLWVSQPDTYPLMYLFIHSACQGLSTG